MRIIDAVVPVMAYSTRPRKPESHYRVAPIGRHGRAPRCARGFTLIELIAVVVILAVLAIVAVPVILSVRMESNVAVLRASSGAFIEAMRMAKAAWYVKSDGGAMVNLPGYGDGTVDFGTSGYPVGTSVSTPAAPGGLTDSRCGEILSAILPGKRAAAYLSYPAPGFDFLVYGAGSVCMFQLLTARGTWADSSGCILFLIYNEPAGSVALSYDCGATNETTLL